MHVVLDAHAAVARQVHARLDGDHGPRWQRIRVGLGQSWRLVNLEPESVAERVTERRAEAARRDRFARECVRVAARHPGSHRGPCPLLRVAHQLVQHPLPFRRARPHHHGAREVGAIAVHLSPEV